METLFLKNEDIFKFYERIALDFELYIPIEIKSPFKPKCDYGFSLPSEDYLIKKYSQLNKEDIVFNEYRAVEPTRTFFAHFKEEICEYFEENSVKKPKEKPLAIAGIKNCDLFSLKVQDFVFLGGIGEDPAYKARRDSTLIITGDCPSFKETCFCRAFEINPHCAEGFDFNLSPLGNGYLVDIATIKAKKIADSLKDILLAATFGQLSGRSAKRETVINRMEEHLQYHKIPKKETLQDIVRSGFNSGIWQEQMKTCVECGGCIFICDTCHCFLLNDEMQQESNKKTRAWDGCLLKNFTRVAGGANPLRMRYMRLRNRYMKKFDFFVDNLGYQACCGCGRCIDVCPGKIDIRYILRKLYEQKYIPAG
ncbi:MAG: 4Fe-4S dicluster domain-containing protein [Candidatus Omnitrophota bacterium]|jgi:ferredoxin